MADMVEPIAQAVMMGQIAKKQAELCQYSPYWPPDEDCFQKAVGSTAGPPPTGDASGFLDLPTSS